MIVINHHPLNQFAQTRVATLGNIRSAHPHFSDSYPQKNSTSLFLPKPRPNLVIENFQLHKLSSRQCKHQQVTLFKGF